VIGLPLHHRAARSGASVHAALVLTLALLVATVAACGGSTTPSASPSAPGGAGTLATPGPKATPWPSSVLEGVLALGAADAELWKAGADIARAADKQDLKAMWGAADGTVKLIEGLMPNVEALEAYPHTQPLGAAYRASFPVMLEGATQLRDSITAGDAKGVVAGSQRLADGIARYADVRNIIEGYAKQALTMKKMLVQ
jgi:hypothetical protein